MAWFERSWPADLNWNAIVATILESPRCGAVHIHSSFPLIRGLYVRKYEDGARGKHAHSESSPPSSVFEQYSASYVCYLADSSVYHATDRCIANYDQT